jgi:hypothetical protein
MPLAPLSRLIAPGVRVRAHESALRLVARQSLLLRRRAVYATLP